MRISLIDILDQRLIVRFNKNFKTLFKEIFDSKQNHTIVEIVHNDLNIPASVREYTHRVSFLRKLEQ